MEERQVTVEQHTYRLPRPFLVVAPQNPIELEGTYPLPEAQLDRFAVRLHPGYPAPEEEAAMVSGFLRNDPLVDLQPVTDPTELQAAVRDPRRVFLGQATLEYLIALVRRTREHESIQLGASPRATLLLARVAQALAFLAGRCSVLPDNVRAVAVPVLAHRLHLTARAQLQGLTAESLIIELLESLPVPVEDLAVGER